MGEDLVLGVMFLEAQSEGDFEEFAVERFLADVEAVARELHAEGGRALGEIPVPDVSNSSACQAAEVHAVVVEEPRVLAGEQGFDEELRDFRAGDEFAAGCSGGGDFHAFAIIENGAGGQPRDFVEIEAHGEHEVKERQT